MAEAEKVVQSRCRRAQKCRGEANRPLFLLISPCSEPSLVVSLICTWHHPPDTGGTVEGMVHGIASMAHRMAHCMAHRGCPTLERVGSVGCNRGVSQDICLGNCPFPLFSFLLRLLALPDPPGDGCLHALESRPSHSSKGACAAFQAEGTGHRVRLGTTLDGASTRACWP